MRAIPSFTAALLLLLPAAGLSADATPPKPGGNSPDEPLAKKWSLAKSAAFLDASSDYWLDKNQCAACHTQYPHLMAAAAFGKPSPGALRVRAFLEKRVAGWDKGSPPDPGSEGITEVVATAASLAFDDAASTGKLQPVTRQALARMWTVQKEDGAWDWNKHSLPPVEHDDYFGAVFAAVGVAAAPEGYAKSAAARAGLARLRRYFNDHPAPDLHHQTWLLWASLRLDGLLSEDEKTSTRKKLYALQHNDGGWSLPALGSWKRLDGTNNEAAASDGYATALVVYVLLQSGSTVRDGAIVRGVKWLETNQRESGRWFTRSLNSDRRHYMTQAGTAFAIMALRAAGRID
jgi:squalene-hopene/tetraprenyl-beta-curcumene cyclase